MEMILMNEKNKRTRWNNNAVQEYLDSNHKGYLLISDYENSKTKIEIECDKRHINKMVWHQFLHRKVKCKKCEEESIIKKFEDAVFKEGYRIVEHIGKGKAVLQCGLLHPSYPIHFWAFHSGSRCKECGFISTKHKNSNTWEEVKNYIEVESKSGYSLIGGEYSNRGSVLIVLCPKGHEYQVGFDRFKYSSARCVTCKKEERLSEKNKKLRKDYEERGYRLISEYKNSKTHVLAVCPEGHAWKHLYSNFSRGADCIECKGNKRKTLEEVKSIYRSKGFEPLFDSYINNKEQLPFHCPKHPELTPQYARTSNMENGHANCRGCYLLLFTGENSSLWSGGLSELNKSLREHLYSFWTRESLEKYDFKCALTGATRDLHVHHLTKNFSRIVKEASENLNVELKRCVGDYEEDEILKLKREVVRLHKRYGLGVPLHRDIHILFHNVYGRRDNNKSQFIEFQKDYQEGKYSFFDDNKEREKGVHYG